MIKTYFVVTVLVSVVSYSLLNYVEIKNSLEFIFDSFKSKDEVEKLFSEKDLSIYTRETLYLAILGKVFDVTKGQRHYGPGQGYHGFVGRDGSKAFITGDFSEEGLTDDISTLSPSDLCGLADWVKLYEKDYVYKGKLIGRFYNENGRNTPFLDEILEKIEVGELEKKSAKDFEYKYPPCNVEWDKEKGSRIWCSTQSGGIKRDWIGFPRKFFQPGKKSFRCACVKDADFTKLDKNRHGNFELYENCQIDSVSCFVKTS